MKTLSLTKLILIVPILTFFSCQTEQKSSGESSVAASGPMAGQSAVKDDLSEPNIVVVASGSADHTTLVTAIKAAEYVDAMVNAGPFTVFAPTNAAFNALPPGTVEGLLKPEMKLTLQDILEYHVAIGVYKLENIRDGQTLGMANGQSVKFEVADGKVKINGANVIGSVPASNGLIHVIDAVLLPK
ncbi:MAG TPA: fasciclin domain-containing protein [Cyclobacteriaceae bacterium]|nr:fasciclin domain-containing protein [Cyclobacteriaceae bacterium]